MWEAACDFTSKNTTVLKPVFEQAKVCLHCPRSFLQSHVCFYPSYVQTATVETATYSWEVTKEVSAIAAENLKPTAELVNVLKKYICVCMCFKNIFFLSHR